LPWVEKHPVVVEKKRTAPPWLGEDSLLGQGRACAGEARGGSCHSLTPNPIPT